MPNQWFRFKNFLVRQEKAAMKVCTDACLFGALVSSRIESGALPVRRVLDIGTGTGLLSLMIAQKCNQPVDAVEIDPATAQEAAANVEQAGYYPRVQVIEGDVTKLLLPAQYDLVISNPPFFDNHLASADAKRNLALHSNSLSFSQLAEVVARVLQDEGTFAVLVPYHATASFIGATNGKLFPVEQVMVRQTEKHAYFRSILFFQKKATNLITSELTIKEGGAYSPAFIDLLKDYYLYL